MAFYDIVESRLRELAYDRKIEIKPSLSLDNTGNIRKVYQLSGAPGVRADFARAAEFFGYTNCDENAFTISDDYSTYVPDDTEAEIISEALESDKNWDDILTILTSIVEDYFFYEDSYYIESSYTMQGDCMND